MATTDDLEDQVDELAMKAKQVTVDGTSTTRRDLSELDDHIDRKLNRAASRSGSGGIGVKFFGLKMPSASGT